MAQPERITRSDIEAKVAEIEHALHGEVERAKPPIYATGIIMSILVIVLAYLFGRRVGAKRTAIVEVKRL
jgi:hypothetical protein